MCFIIHLVHCKNYIAMSVAGQQTIRSWGVKGSKIGYIHGEQPPPFRALVGEGAFA